MLTCARSACVTTGSLKELPEHWRTAAFRQQGALHCMRDHHKHAVMVAVAVEVGESEIAADHQIERATWWRRADVVARRPALGRRALVRAALAGFDRASGLGSGSGSARTMLL